MCCILFKWNKLRPLLQVAKLSVYNLSNKHVFYSGFCCVVCIIKNYRYYLEMLYVWIATLFYFIPSTSGWAHQHELKSFEHNEGCGQRLATFGFWLCEADSCTTGQSERHHSISSHALLLGEFVATSLTLNLHVPDIIGQVLVFESMLFICM